MALPIAAAAGGIQAALGVAQTVKGAIDSKRIMRELKAFRTPEEVTKMLNATQAAAQQGYDAFTLSYLNNNFDRAASESLGAATRLGANANELSPILDQRMQAITKVGAENHNLNMQNFTKYLGALDVVAKNKEAEWASEQNMVKDKLQAATQNKREGIQNLMGAANTAISMEASQNMMDMWKDKSVADTGTSSIPDLGRVSSVDLGRTMPTVGAYGAGVTPVFPATGTTGAATTLPASLIDLQNAIRGLQLPNFRR